MSYVEISQLIFIWELSYDWFLYERDIGPLKG